MRKSNGRFFLALAMVGVGVVAGVPMVSFAQAQGATPPAREKPNPEDIDPAVNTSATPPANEESTPAQNAGSVAGSKPSGSPTAVGATKGAAPGASPSSGSSSAGATSSAASKAGTPGAPANVKQGTASTPAPAAAAKQGTASSSDGTKPKGKSLDRLELDTTQITGNRELPKVLYIVPWKRSDLGDLVGKPVNSLLDEVLAPVDRDVFKRENRYYRALTPAEGANAGNGAAKAASSNGATPTGTAPAGATSGGSAAPPARDEK